MPEHGEPKDHPLYDIYRVEWKDLMPTSLCLRMCVLTSNTEIALRAASSALSPISFCS